ncbi:MAG: hypothetical protein K8S56_03275, partial [Candidatus Cloacimonetes bacterium]|nr:hypothetical protein [Candidatus Cloacimonadota bacterium]
TVGAIPANAVDWVYVQLRETPTGASVFERSYFVQDDGFVVDEAGGPIGGAIADGSYYVVVMQRNHLAVMSAVPFLFDGTGALVCDLTLPDACYNGGIPNDGVNELEPGIYGMIAGETTDPGSTGGTISDPDKGLVNTGNGLSGYQLADVNFSATVTDPDKGFINLNNGKSCQVPGIIFAIAAGANININSEIVEINQNANKTFKKQDSKVNRNNKTQPRRR